MNLDLKDLAGSAVPRGFWLLFISVLYAMWQTSLATDRPFEKCFWYIVWDMFKEKKSKVQYLCLTQVAIYIPATNSCILEFQQVNAMVSTLQAVAP